MSSAADRLRATGEKFVYVREVKRDAPADVPEDTADAARSDDDPTARRGDTVRVRKVRMSVDVPSGRHESLQDWCTAEGRTRGYRVSTNMLMNALVAEFLSMSDATIAQTIGKRVELDRPDPPRGRRRN